MLDVLRRALEAEPDVVYAILFGSTARGTTHFDSDVDVAVELAPGVERDIHAILGLMARLSSAVGRDVDVVLLDEAPPGLAYRIFRDGHVIIERDRPALVTRKTRAILDYLDFQPVEERCADGILRAAAARGR